jgi:hypothetical protein
MAQLFGELSVYRHRLANHHHLMRYATEAAPNLVWFNFAHLF